MSAYLLQVSTGLCIKQEREYWKGTDCCSWKGVGCDHTNGGHVVKLDLRNYEYFYSSALLSNGVDSSLFESKYLNYLGLSANFFNYTPIPNSFGGLLGLTYLNLSSTYFHGAIQPFLGNLTKLLVLDFNNKGQLNEYLDLSGVRVVESGKLDVDYLIQLLNSIPSCFSLNLSSSALQNYQLLDAPLNSSFRSKLQHLDLSYNEFDGPIPIILRNMTSLRYLNLNGCKEYGLQRLYPEEMIGFGMHTIPKALSRGDDWIWDAYNSKLVGRIKKLEVSFSSRECTSWSNSLLIWKFVKSLRLGYF
uniref:Leucine-rich repeat-containing N-terminal plant-type domain-containing protein n=1 Tax=Cucumis sativus TaxID=3659 RepID=A0A0A0LUW2_CUCSA